MEACLQQVEQELNVRVERLDIVRQPAAQAVLATLAQQSNPPFLFHRESCQTIHVQGTAAGESNNNNNMPVRINHNRVRAWAKGRYLPSSEGRILAGNKVANPNLVLQQDENSAMSQDELLEVGMLTPTQRQGKEAIQQRTDAQASNE